MDNNVDSQSEVGYTTSNDGNVIVVKLDEQAPVNDTRCRHPKLVADPDDRIGEAIYHGCTNQKCGVGFYIQPAK